MIGMIYSNFWVPQIVRSARRGTASGLRAEYLVGTTACRAFFALCMFFLSSYCSDLLKGGILTIFFFGVDLFACPKNVLDIDTSRMLPIPFFQVLK